MLTNLREITSKIGQFRKFWNIWDVLSKCRPTDVSNAIDEQYIRCASALDHSSHKDRLGWFRKQLFAQSDDIGLAITDERSDFRIVQ